MALEDNIMKIIVMGAGYVGIPLLEELGKLGFSMTVTTTDPSKVEGLKVYSSEVVLLNEEDQHQLTRLIERHDGMVVLIAPKGKKSYEETYLKMARKISESLKGRKTPFYLLYTGSTSVYEGITTEWGTEEMLLEGESENSKILLESERYFLKWPSACVLRLGGIFGPERDLEKRARYFSGKELPGTGDEPTNHIHRDDIVAAILFCLKHRLTGIFNLVNDEHPSRKELYQNLCASLSLPLPRWNPHLEGSRKGYKISNAKIKASGFHRFSS